METNVRDFILVLTSIVWEAMPFIVLGVVVGGLLEEFLPQGMITRILPGNRPLAIGLSALLGLLFPMCECGIIPVMRRLLRKGLPVSCCVAYVLGGPIINVVVIISTYVAFAGRENDSIGGQSLHQMGGWWMVTLRVGLGWLVAVGTSLIVEWQYRIHGIRLLAASAVPDALGEHVDEIPDPKRPRPNGWTRTANIAGTALHDFVDIMVFLILGAVIAAAVRLVLTHNEVDFFSHSYPFLAIVLMMALAVVLCLCSEADAFVAASFISLPPASKVAFLVLGPMLDFKLFFMYTRVFSQRLIWTIIASVVVQVFVYAVLTHFAWESGFLERVSAPMRSLIW